MADLYDQASAREEQDRADAPKVRLPTLKACGACHYCNEPLHTGMLFCNKECRDDYEAWQDAQRRNGK